MLILAAATGLVPSVQTSAASAPNESIIRAVFETTLGDIEIAVYPSRAPISAGNFLAYVDGGHYDGATLYRAARKSAPGTIGIVQGGLLAAAMSGDSPYLDSPSAPFPSISHETTHATGIPNERGTLTLARLEPGTASSEFFFNLSDNPELDTGAGIPGRDDFGHATFGRVVRGIGVLDSMLELPADGETTIVQVRGQILRDPVRVRRAYRVPARPLHDAIRGVLLNEWDPIGVVDIPGAQDEYDSYIPTIYRLLIRREPVYEVFDYLWWAETKNMGLSGNRQRTEQVAERLVGLTEPR